MIWGRPFATFVNTFRKTCETLSVNGKSLCHVFRRWALYILAGLLAGTLTKEYLLNSLPIIFQM